MAEDLWRPSLDLALHRNRRDPEFRLVQLATIREDGHPAVRTVVFRGFLSETHKPVFATDTRSVKIAELNANPWTEICWYFARTKEQFRLSGTMALVGPETLDPIAQEARQAIWQAMSEAARLSYTWPEPGKPREPLTPFPTTPPDPLVPLDHYALLVLDITEVDHLELDGNPQHRWQYHRDRHGRWAGVEINP